MKKILFRESSLKKDCRTIPVMLLGLMLTLFPLQIISQETDIGKVVTENVETTIEGAEETQEAVEDTVPRLVQPDEIGPSLDEAIQEGEQKSSLEELLAVPFDQIKDGGESADSTDETEDLNLQNPSKAWQNKTLSKNWMFFYRNSFRRNTSGLPSASNISLKPFL